MILDDGVCPIVAWSQNMLLSLSELYMVCFPWYSRQGKEYLYTKAHFPQRVRRRKDTWETDHSGCFGRGGVAVLWDKLPLGMPLYHVGVPPHHCIHVLTWKTLCSLLKEWTSP